MLFCPGMTSAKPAPDWRALILVFILVTLLDSNVQDYFARQWNKKAFALQIERLKAQVNVPERSEADVRSLADTELSASERTDYRQNAAFFISHARAWEVTYAPQSISNPRKRLRIWVDDATGYPSRYDYD